MTKMMRMPFAAWWSDYCKSLMVRPALNVFHHHDHNNNSSQDETTTITIMKCHIKGLYFISYSMDLRERAKPKTCLSEETSSAATSTKLY